ncbi:hypothetical protein BS47DRAFT_1201500 [Hydnum rufescens UP504]|uniref:BHLH domain-containing protein n=1 Tax=Hydnum rufescens UP504 TaxID=1448309 RepID=A0A9P6ATE6_9AGAM|nr:hypothetical protein BS47DRAFT_1201500 [Hydnum rufescens UP504]
MAAPLYPAPQIVPLRDRTTINLRDVHDSSDSMDDEDYSASPSVEGSSGSSLGSISPKAEPELRPNFDLSYFLSLANNPDMSSSSSESQSQGSRSGSPPSDWHSTSWPDTSQSSSDSWKWAGDSLMSDGVVDPGSLVLGNLGADDIFANPAFDGSNIPHFTGDELSMFDYENGVPAVTPSLYSVPQIVEPPTSTPMLSATPNPGLDVESIGRRARELAGVQYAIQQTRTTTNYSPYTTSVMHGVVPKSTVPFAPPPPFPQVRTEAPSVPSPSTSSPIPEAASESGLGVSRPKTAHTTIERRYRTNLNARFIALRHAIPALRVLEKTKFPDEKADDKGYVDGVKAARKASKGTVLGKASEYIRYAILRLEQEEYILISCLVQSPEAS